MSIWDAFGKGRYKGFSREAGQLLDKAVELALIDGYCVGSITPQQMRTWLNEAAEVMHRRESRRDWTCRQDVLSDE